MSDSFGKFMVVSAASALLLAVGASSFAADTWAQNHPRRAEVNSRLANQNRRIHQQVKKGDISKSQAAALHRDDHAIRQEERDMAHQNGGHITKSEQHVLNQQENGVSQQIGH
jgi:hypothetical protein